MTSVAATGSEGRPAGRVSGYSAATALLAFLYFGLRIADRARAPVRRRASTTRRSRSGRSPGGCTRSSTDQNPLVTHDVWAPSGVNLAWVNTVPALAVAFAPLTALVGPVAAYDVAAVLLPALSAWTRVPALPAPHRTLLAVARRRLPVRLLELRARARARTAAADGRLRGAADRARRRACARGRRSGRGASSSGSGLLLALQIYLSTEVALTATIALVLGLRSACSSRPRRDSARSGTARPAALGAYASRALLAAPLLYYALDRPPRRRVHAARGLHGRPAELRDPDAPRGRRRGLGAHDRAALPRQQHRAGRAHRAAAARDRRPLRRARAGGRRGAGSCSPRSRSRPTSRSGPRLIVDGHRVIPLPTLLGHQTLTLAGSARKFLPLFDNILPVRFALYASLAGAVIAAIWMASTRSRRPPLAASRRSPCSCSSRTPAPASGRRPSRCRRSSRAAPTGRASHRTRSSCPSRSATGGQAMLWQAADGLPLPDGGRPAPDLAAEQVPAPAGDRADLGRPTAGRRTRRRAAAQLLPRRRT